MDRHSLPACLGECKIPICIFPWRFGIVSFDMANRFSIRQELYDEHNPSQERKLFRSRYGLNTAPMHMEANSVSNVYLFFIARRKLLKIRSYSCEAIMENYNFVLTQFL